MRHDYQGLLPFAACQVDELRGSQALDKETTPRNSAVASSMNYFVRHSVLANTSITCRLALSLIALAACLSAGCATYADNLAIVRQEFVTGDLAKAEAAVEKG